MAGSRMFTARIPEPEYEAMRAFATVAGTSMNEVVLRALRGYLIEQGDGELVRALLERTAAAFRATIDRLSE